MYWSSDDVKRWKETLREKRYHSERAIYPFLGKWIKNRCPTSKVFFGRMKGSSPPTMEDVVEATTEGELIGYEVKMAHIGGGTSSALQTTYVIQGIGQALEYLYYGMDRSYLVAPRVTGLKYLSDMLKRTVPFLGLILFDNTFNFNEIIKAKKIQIYPPSHRELAEFSYLAEEVQMDRNGCLTWVVKGVKHSEPSIEFNEERWREILMGNRWREIKAMLKEFPELRERVRKYLTETTVRNKG